MALTAVVTNGFLGRLLPVLKKLDQDHETGPLTLAMLVPSSVDENFRSLVLASPALDKIGLLQATSRVLQILNDQLGKESHKIDTVSILRTNNSAVRLLSQSYDIPELGTAYQAMGLPAMSLGLDDPILFISKQAEPVAA